MHDKKLAGHIEIGPDTLQKLPELLSECGHKVLLVHGHRPVEDGLLSKVRTLLAQSDFPYASMGQILPNPKIQSVKRGVKIAREENCDIILALGGGSTLQCAKAIALGVKSKGKIWSYWTGRRKPKKALPVASILTNPASGTELSDGCTLVDKGKRKTIHSPLFTCAFAILDPTLAAYPFYPTMNQIFTLFVDLFTDALDSDQQKQQEAMELLKDLLDTALALEGNNEDVKARTRLFEIGLKSHRELGRESFGYKDLANKLAFVCSMPDGSAASSLFTAWCLEQEPERQEQIAKVGAQVLGLEEAAFEQTLEALRQQIAHMRLPRSLKETGIHLSEEDWHALAHDKTSRRLLERALKDQTV